MIDNNATIQPEKVRVSIFERIVPFGAFGLAALAGGLGSYLIVDMFRTLAAAKNAGIAGVSGGLAEYMTVSLVLLYASCALGFVGICVAI
jgi:phage shock protein PspC (stress-responsive transcriptional regulator)